jgi:DNA-binding NarL/FixJ family response regulator
MDDGTGRYAVEILLFEDDQGDVVMITEAFEQSGAPIPVLILTTSAAPPDVQRSYSLHASAYVS